MFLVEERCSILTENIVLTEVIVFVTRGLCTLTWHGIVDGSHTEMRIRIDRK